MGLSSELEYLLLLAHDLGYLQANVYQSMQNDLVEMRKMLNAFNQKLKANR
jgi:four helix bundle protein